MTAEVVTVSKITSVKEAFVFTNGVDYLGFWSWRDRLGIEWVFRTLKQKAEERRLSSPRDRVKFHEGARTKRNTFESPWYSSRIQVTCATTGFQPRPRRKSDSAGPAFWASKEKCYVGKSGCVF
jgi:hypothetical protein